MTKVNFGRNDWQLVFVFRPGPHSYMEGLTFFLSLEGQNRTPKGGYLCPSLLPAQSPWIRLVRDTANPKSPEIAAIRQQLQRTPRASVVPMARKWEETTTRLGHTGHCECPSRTPHCSRHPPAHGPQSTSQ